MPADNNVPSAEQYSVALITEDKAAFSEMRLRLIPSFQITLASTDDQIKALVEDAHIRGVLFDLDCIEGGAKDGVEVLKEIRRLRDDVALLAMTESTDPSIPLLASQAGADEFFLVPVDYGELGMVFVRAIEKRALEIEGRRLLHRVENKSAFCGMIGGSAAMQKVYQAIRALADSNASVLLRGESGTGKELIAQAIMHYGNRADKPYVCLNCSALPETLLESELFGYERGAFTGADAAKPGLIETAHTGTLFLDEITTLNHGLQSKLLRALQERAVQRLGGRNTRKIDFRLITATNDDLEDMVHKGRFREDLYYRIHVIPISVPPLREREGDIPLLVEHFLRLYCTANKKPVKRVPPDVIEILEDYAWPGNVR